MSSKTSPLPLPSPSTHSRQSSCASSMLQTSAGSCNSRGRTATCVMLPAAPAAVPLPAPFFLQEAPAALVAAVAAAGTAAKAAAPLAGAARLAAQPREALRFLRGRPAPLQGLLPAAAAAVGTLPALLPGELLVVGGAAAL